MARALTTDRIQPPALASLSSPTVPRTGRLFGNEHEEVAAALDRLANVYQNQQRYDESEARFVEALDVRRALHGDVFLV